MCKNWVFFFVILSIFINCHVFRRFDRRKGWIHDFKHQSFMCTFEMKTIHAEATYGGSKIVKLSRMRQFVASLWFVVLINILKVCTNKCWQLRNLRTNRKWFAFKFKAAKCILIRWKVEWAHTFCGLVINAAFFYWNRCKRALLILILIESYL